MEPAENELNKYRPTGMYVTDEMREHEPADEDCFLRKKNGDWARLIFGEPQELKEREEEHLEKFVDYVQENGLEPVPEWFMADTRVGLRYIQGCAWDYEKAYQEIFIQHNWINETFPIDPRPFKTFLQSGALYCNDGGRAKRGLQPIVVLNLRKFIDQSVEPEILEPMSSYFFDFVVRNYMVQGRVENWFMIIDFKGVGVTELPIRKLKTFMVGMMKKFRGRMFRCFAVDSPFLMRAVWKLVLTWVDESLQQKIIINGGGYEDQLLEYIDAEELEVKYGGTKLNRAANFFPIDLE